MSLRAGWTLIVVKFDDHDRGFDIGQARVSSRLGTPESLELQPLLVSLLGVVRDRCRLRERLLSMATENRTFVATENCTLLGRTSRAERTFSR